jgi:hypothetical protein
MFLRYLGIGGIGSRKRVPWRENACRWIFFVYGYACPGDVHVCEYSMSLLFPGDVVNQPVQFRYAALILFSQPSGDFLKVGGWKKK